MSEIKSEVGRRRLPDDISDLNRDQLLEWRQHLIEAKIEIEASLGNRGKTTDGGRLMTAVEYWTWRNKAVHAKRFIERDISRVKAELSKRGDKGERFAKRPGYMGPFVELLESLSDWPDCPREVAVKAESLRSLLVEHYLI